MNGHELLTIDRATLERIFRAVRRVESADKSGDAGAGGSSAAPRTIPLINASGVVVPQFACGWTSGADAPVDGVLKVYRPAYPGVSRLVIVADEIPIGSSGHGWTEGIVPVRVSNWAGVAAGDRIGAQPDSWDASLDPLGPMLVLGKWDSPIVLALITGQRGDHKMCYCGQTGPSGPYQVIIFGPGHTVVEDSPGNLTVRRAT